MAFTIGQHVILKMNDVQVGNWEVILGTTNPSQVFVRALRVDYGLDQLVIDYPHVNNFIGDNVGLPIPWAIEDMMIRSNEVWETSIESSIERIEFICNDEEMIEALNSRADMYG